MSSEVEAPSPTFRQRGYVRLKRLLFLVASTYLAALLVMFSLEHKLIFPAPRYPAGDWEPAGLQFEDVYFVAADGTQLHGWYLDHPAPKAYVLYNHGNGEHVAYLAPLLEQLRDDLNVSVFAYDYRGYGRSEGAPSEEGVLADGRAAHAWLADRTGVQPANIVLMGRSLGGAVAIDLATTTGPRGLVLESTFPSMPDVAAQVYWWAPVRLLMRTRLNSAEKIRNYTGPLLQSHGMNDEIIPIALGRKLYDAAASTNKQLIEMPRLGHNDWPSPQYYAELARFIDDLPGEPSS
ncbi:MAG: alpha/beta hydrolase [Planctomycetaceae bacterium]|nr:alpha/beta hydrolase [Planctomycetaceae bacterium]